eukprot:TRINITY_DN2195_c1_g1_i9.p2 TRINITY_DN2195_c1_g1~~TRINITY_DN2195_c1_g1_i9.p2  ORF type:complete len:139 (-),score=11.60 TRINITY_DN2195_c1_g1_i9:4-420(-)
MLLARTTEVAWEQAMAILIIVRAAIDHVCDQALAFLVFIWLVAFHEGVLQSILQVAELCALPVGKRLAGGGVIAQVCWLRMLLARTTEVAWEQAMAKHSPFSSLYGLSHFTKEYFSPSFKLGKSLGLMHSHPFLARCS